jgi:Sortase domain
MSVGEAARPSTTGRLFLVTLLGVVVVGCGSPAADRMTTGSATAPTATRSPTPEPSSGVSGFRSPRRYTSVAVPVRVRIPRMGIDSTLQHLGLAADGTIQAPSQWQRAGWYDRGPRPGQQGPAVIVGHVDSTSGPAVFYRLRGLRRGDDVYVDRADGTTAHFQVTGRRQFPKSRFPADLVYSPTLKTSLQLMTCGGSFNRSTGHYRDNVIVSAGPV